METPWVSERSAVVVHLAHHLPMDEERRVRVVDSLTALLLPRLRDRAMPSTQLDFPEVIEVSSKSAMRITGGDDGE